uniref:BMA-GLH-4, isoform b n=1 Tax=Brugia malayi TaxID=6279 RepID=A0A1I9G3U9_BRUMA|nr:BMA-GLH-4, isoform b [Brugia malayi]
MIHGIFRNFRSVLASRTAKVKCKSQSLLSKSVACNSIGDFASVWVQRLGFDICGYA